eukprot:scaffold703_cov168-Amphora_coffeaeformis.AAC.9
MRNFEEAGVMPGANTKPRSNMAAHDTAVQAAADVSNERNAKRKTEIESVVCSKEGGPQSDLDVDSPNTQVSWRMQDDQMIRKANNGTICRRGSPKR